MNTITRDKQPAICYTYGMSVPYDPDHVTYFAETDYRNQKTRFGIKSRDRTRHMYVIGKSGVGKSTLLENMAIQDIARGEGLAVLDPHGSFAEKMLDYIPMERIKDVIYFAPFDTENPISFNVLEDVGADKRHFVASGLMSTFKKIWVDAWSARMEYILNNILLALLESPDATLLGVNRMLSDKAFRERTVAQVTDPGVKAFWVEEFAKYGDRYMQEAGAAIQNKIGQFTASPLIRNLIGQPKSSFDIRQAMDNQKILIVNLSKGRIGEQNTSLLGSMIITKIYLAAMSRADASPARLAELPNFYFYVDEFQSFANESFSNILSEARKYKLALVIAHQYVAQMEESVRDAVFGNVGTSISFRVGPLDGELLEKVFSPQFSANDLVNLGMAQIYLSLLINDMGSSPFSARTLPPVPKPPVNYRNDVIESSRALYAQPRDVVEKNINDWFGKDAVPAATSVSYNKEQQTRQPYQPREQQPRDQQQQQQQQTQTQPSVQSSQKFTPPTHTPFKKAFTATPPAQRFNDATTTSGAARVFHPIAKNAVAVKKPISPIYVKQNDVLPVDTVAISPALDTLLSSLDSTEQPVPVQPIVQPAAPFTGEKPLRDAIPPVKLSERGPTEKNRDLLKAALQNIAQQQKPMPSISVTSTSNTTNVTNTTNTILTASVASATPPPITTPPVEPSPVATTIPAVQPEEIPYQSLQKILE